MRNWEKVKKISEEILERAKQDKRYEMAIEELLKKYEKKLKGGLM